MQDAGAVAALVVELQHARQAPGVVGAVLGQLPVPLGVGHQPRVAQHHVVLERQAQDEVHALAGHQLMQGL
ncbi:hypothetical protein PFLmoz3_05940 [Pseudomonas fluorescens]|uniref:Uncharacterized protein n=1 Tax=Pseudomonas fluorescens TaxID=294 RepID=A0A125QHG5_PSEFL|nr:hypothetical protein PFLmoz3_05940 [Pseudomonas fluorescens]